MPFEVKNGFFRNFTFGDPNFDRSCFWVYGRQKSSWKWSQWPYIIIILPHGDILKVSEVKKKFKNSCLNYCG